MSDNPTPVEGKGDEMIPQRGLPFEEEPEDEVQIFEEDGVEDEDEEFSMESIDELLDQIPRDISDETANSLEEPLPEGQEFEEVNLESEVVSETEIASEPEELEAPTFPVESSPLLDLEEIRFREQELAEDFQVPAPDFDGETDEDFATARVPAAIPDLDRESIMLESGAGLLQEDVVITEDEPESKHTPADKVSNVALMTEEEVTKETVTQSASPSQPQNTIAEKETRVTRKQALFREESIGHPGPTDEIEEDNAPELVRDLKASKKLLDLLIPNSRLEELWERADRLQVEIFHEINELHDAQKLLEQIRSAKTLILAEKANFEEAERALNEVEYRIIYGQRAKKWGFLGYLLLFYEVAFGVGASLVVALLIRAGETGLNLPADGLLTSGEIYIGILAALFGSLGGVAGALFALWRYVTKQKFNPQFSMWYITQPIIGLTVGIVIYLIIKIGLNITVGSSTAEVGSPLIPCLLAYLVGYQQNVFLDLARQVFKRFEIGEKEEPENAG